ncbi:hypothetical protein UFOVP464_24 [uncultured Caudovirales phage]|uniref:Uncharacterized protein n=1 Tax=uncultured Caudovirales phage TaxID=2100421 RepID=A0A6J5QXG5_9CAUD|nr:hypothetical protein UFOVP464_24 [uncultured Caudovirales phage]CAB4189300.1 hypothetical protein UFOVP1189_39 [uncultured Caudovirales phage]
MSDTKTVHQLGATVRVSEGTRTVVYLVRGESEAELFIKAARCAARDNFTSFSTSVFRMLPKKKEAK